MTIQITLSADETRKLAELAKEKGKEPSVYVHDVVAAYLKGAGRNGGRTFEEIVAPIWEEWHRSGLNDHEIDDLFEQEVHELRRERRAKEAS